MTDPMHQHAKESMMRVLQKAVAVADDPEREGTVYGPFALKDSGKRETFDSGMVRDTTEGKIDYTLMLDGPMLDRWGDLLTKGAAKYAVRNWMLANGPKEVDRFRQSALRHLIQWLRGDTDEDHAAAVFFNINGAEYVKHVAPLPVPGMPTGFRLERLLPEGEVCPRCASPMEWVHSTWKCPNCQFKLGCCEGAPQDGGW